MKDVRVIKNHIRSNHSSLGKVDKHLKITRVKLTEVNFRRELEDGRKVYRVKYKFGLNLFNPLSWILVILPTLFIEIFKSSKEILCDLGMDTFSDDILIKEED